MEENNSSSIFSDDLKLDLQDLSYLVETSKWVRFLSICGMIASGLIIIIFPILFFILGRLGNSAMFGPIFSKGIFISVIYMLIGGLYFYISLLMYRFANYLRNAIDNGNQNDLTEAFRNQNLFFKIAGIITAIYLGLVAVWIIFIIISFLFIGTRF